MKRRKPKKTLRSELGEHFNEGALRMWSLLETNGWGFQELTTRLGCATGLVTRWLYGDQRPGRAWSNKIETVFGVPHNAWDQEASVSFVPPAARVTPPESGTDVSPRRRVTGTDDS